MKIDKEVIKTNTLKELVTLITKTMLNEIYKEGKYVNGNDKEETYSDMLQRVEDKFNRNINDPNYFNYKRTDPRDAVDQDGKKLVVPVDEESHDENKIPGAFVDRGQVKLEGGIDQQLADKIANYHWDIMQSMGKNEQGVFDYKTRGDRYCCSVGLLNGRPAILSITTTPGRLNLLVGNKEIFGTDQSIKEESTTGGVGGYNIPAAFSRKDGGSKAALKGSESLGYTLTPAGKKDFSRHPDRMLESGDPSNSMNPAHHDCKEEGHSWIKVKSKGDMTEYKCRYCKKTELM